jgi:hypothetical protein
MRDGAPLSDHLRQQVTSMRATYPLALGLLAALAAAAPAHAGEWVIVGTDGARPDRTIWYADFSSLTSRFPPGTDALAARAKDPLAALEAARIMRIRVQQVLEDAQGPDSIQYSLEFKCQERQVSIPEVNAYYRDNGRSESQSRPNWMPIPDGWLARTAVIACQPEKWEPALNTLQKKRDPRALGELGLAYAGSHVMGTDLPDLSWRQFWKDGTRPAYTTNKSPEELERLRQQTLATLADTNQQLGQRADTMRQGLKDQHKELSFIAAVAKTFRAKPEAQQRYFNSMQGWSEPEIAAFWGPPSRTYENAQERYLQYRAEDDRRKSFVVVDGGSNAVSAAHYGELRQCELNFVLRPGGAKPGWRVVDYQLTGQNCKASTLGTLVR